MSAIIWKPKYNFISPQVPFEIIIERADGSELATDVSGSVLSDIVNGTTTLPYQIATKKVLTSMGFGHEYFNWDEFWTAAENYNSLEWQNLGGGIGATSRTDLMPYKMETYQIISPPIQAIPTFLDNVKWEVEDFSISATIRPEFLFDLGGGTSTVVEPYFMWQEPYHPEINGNTNANLILNNFNLPSYPSFWGQQGDTAVAWDWYFDRPSLDLPENHNICLSISLYVSRAGGFQNQIPVTINPADIANVNIEENPKIYLSIPYKTYDDYLDLTSNITNLNVPSIVAQGETVTGTVTIQSNDYAGIVELFLLDKTNLDQAKSVIGDSLNWYGELEDSVAAQYGTLNIIDPSVQIYNYGCAFEISRGETKDIDFEYVADTEFGGQTDTYAIFIRSNNFDSSPFDNDLDINADDQFNLLNIESKWDFLETAYMYHYTIYETPALEYNPSEITLIEKPSDIVYHMMENELGYDKDVDQISLENSRIAHSNYKLGFSVNEAIESKQLLQEIMQSSKSFVTLSNNLLKFITLNDTYNGSEEISTIDADDVINYKFSRTPLSEIKTQVEIKYNWDYGLEKYKSSTGLLKINESVLSNKYFKSGTQKDFLDGNLKDINYYGIKTDEISQKIDHIDTFLTYESKYIRDLQTALELAQYLLLWNCNQHNIVSLTLPIKYFNLEIGDIIDFNKMILGRKIYNEKYVIDTPDDMPIRCGQYILPVFMITKTQKSLNNVKLEAIQLHHMQDSSLEYKNNIYNYGSTSYTQENIETQSLKGDVNLNGSAEVGDIVLMVNHILGDSTLTGQALQNADMNNDGQIRVNDVVLLVNKILGIENV